MAKSEGRPGRPKKPESEKLEQFSIRLPPKLKYGLELLARLQGRSLSQSVEWALQHALANVKVTDGIDLWFSLSTAWDLRGWRRIYWLYESNPILVSFEERHACALVVGSLEFDYINSLWFTDEKKHKELVGKWDEIIEWAWPKLCADAREMGITGGKAHHLCKEFSRNLGTDLNCLDFDEVIESTHARLQELNLIGKDASVSIANQVTELGD